MEDSSIKHFLIKMTLEELKYIGSILEEKPYKESAKLIHNIQNQVNRQVDELENV